VVAELCDLTKPGQLWTTNAIGELSTMEDKNLCLTNLQGLGVLRMTLCKLSPDQVFVFDIFYQSLLWIKNKAQSAKYGLRALTIITEPNTADSSKVYVKTRKGKPMQKWDIVYPTSTQEID
jgi:hypothetical protein